MNKDHLATGIEPSILTEVRDAVAIVTLNRPTRLNAWTPQMATLYFDALETFASDPSVRVILVNGSGRAFCSGADMSTLSDMAAGEAPPERDHRPYSFAMSIGKPVVAAIHGACFGVGAQQALCCDIRFVADDLKFATAYSRRGLVGELAIAWNLVRLTGYGTALELLMSGRTIGGEEALRIGIAHYLSPAETLFNDAFAYCLSLAQECSPWSMRMIKQQVFHDLENSLTTAYAHSDILLDTALKNNDFMEGVSAFREKRKNQFRGLDSTLGLIPSVHADKNAI